MPMNRKQRQNEAGCQLIAWEHQPPAIREAIRRYRLRPLKSRCTYNCGRLMLWADSLRGRLAYHEGIVHWTGIEFDFEHAWLTLDGERVDLTLDISGLTYGPSYTVPEAEIHEFWSRTGRADFVRQERLQHLWLSRENERRARFGVPPIGPQGPAS
jgi:hypothetical protein